ncbi:MAG: VanZ family protein [Saprospiraceae bacterium]
MNPFLPAIIWSIVIAALSLGSGIQLPSEMWQLLEWDKVGHFGVYAVECFLLLKGFYQIGRRNPLPAILLALFFGLTLEVLQYAFFPHRHFEWDDLLANTLGTLVGYGVFKRLIHYLKF